MSGHEGRLFGTRVRSEMGCSEGRTSHEDEFPFRLLCLRAGQLVAGAVVFYACRPTVGACRSDAGARWHVWAWGFASAGLACS